VTEKPSNALPGFFVEWRDGFGPDATLSPLDYLNRDAAVPFVIAAKWLFCPEFVEYRGCVLAAKNRLPTESGLDEYDRKIVDSWFDALGDHRPAVEAKANLLMFDSVFSSADTTAFDDDLPGLAQAVAQCWQGLLAVRYPGRRFTFEVQDDADGGPELTFFSTAE
jgi:hypothetical protein